MEQDTTKVKTREIDRELNWRICAHYFSCFPSYSSCVNDNTTAVVGCISVPFTSIILQNDSVCAQETHICTFKAEGGALSVTLLQHLTYKNIYASGRTLSNLTFCMEHQGISKHRWVKLICKKKIVKNVLDSNLFNAPVSLCAEPMWLYTSGQSVLPPLPSVHPVAHYSFQAMQWSTTIEDHIYFNLK